MSYLLDRKAKRQRNFLIAILIICIALVGYFRQGIFKGLSVGTHTVFTPVLSIGKGVSQKFSSVTSFFASKNSLLRENENLKAQLAEKDNTLTSFNILLDENNKLKETMGRAGTSSNFLLAAILAKPNQSPYDTIIIDAGSEKGVKEGNKVYAMGDVPIGRVSEVHSGSSNVILFSNPGEKTQVVLPGKDIFIEAVGRGGGNMEINLTDTLTLEKGNTVTLPGITPHVVGIVQSTITDARNPFVKALLVSPVNIQELKFVEVER